MYTTADEASGAASAADFDVDAIFDATFEYSSELGRFVQTVDEDGFWAAVQAGAK